MRHLLLAALLAAVAAPAAAATPDAPTETTDGEMLLAYAGDYGGEVAAAAAPSSPASTLAIVTHAEASSESEKSEVPELPDSGLDPGEDPAGFLEASYQAVRAGDWLLFASTLVIGLVFVARRFGGSVWPWLETDRGGVALAGATALLGGLGHAVAAGAGLSGGLVLDALAVAVGAMGGYAGLRRLLNPKE